MEIKLTLVPRPVSINYPPHIQYQKLTTGPVLNRSRVRHAKECPAPPPHMARGGSPHPEENGRGGCRPTPLPGRNHLFGYFRA